MPRARRAARLTWSQLIPAGAPPAPAPLPIHDLANALSEAGPAASQQSPNAPVVKALDGIEAKLPGYIVPLEISEAGLVTEFLLVPTTAPASTYRRRRRTRSST